MKEKNKVKCMEMVRTGEYCCSMQFTDMNELCMKVCLLIDFRNGRKFA